ncbi:MAG TPA: helix-hairpin-helix domain-containing protein [Pyrinomonadaceae bacterium]|nr:helix-hairpin-helix domain-containing protein [Pyrinomonadaceae bacterium]
MPRRARPAPPAVNPAHAATISDVPRLDLNRATREELERLPGVGPVLAARIVEHRERHGPFRRVEHLLVVRGVSERRFQELRHLVTAE